MSKPKAVGIDLGTTFSVVAWVNDRGHTEIIRNPEGGILTPSIVLFEDAEVVVGKDARNALGVHPDRVAEFVKRDMGAPVYTRPIRGEYLPPEVIQACVLRKLRSSIIKTLGPDTRAVITVPAYFDEPRRKGTADAGEMAGLTLLDIVNEPTAAALAFGETLGYLSPSGEATEEMTILVYDLGGGTFDATLLRLAPGEIRALATDGDVQLGGHDWDLRLLHHVAGEFKSRHGADPREDLGALNRLYSSVLDAKHALTARNRATVRVDFAGYTDDIPVTRELFEELTVDLLERTSYTTRQLMATAGLEWSDVSRVLLVGGATRMPMIQRMLTETTGIIPDHTVNPDEAVARGAALYAHYLLSKDGEVLPQEGEAAAGPAFEVVNINSHSLGVEGIDPETFRKVNVVLIPRNTTLPTKVTEKFITKTEGQRSIAVKVLEGESTIPSECTTIGRTSIRDLPAGLPKAWPIEVTFEYATNGRLTVRAVVPGTHREVSLDLERESGMSPEGIAQWREAMDGQSGLDAFERMLQEASAPDRAITPPDTAVHPASMDQAASQAAAPYAPDPRWNSPPFPAAAAPDDSAEATQDFSAEPSDELTQDFSAHPPAGNQHWDQPTPPQSPSPYPQQPTPTPPQSPSPYPQQPAPTPPQSPAPYPYPSGQHPPPTPPYPSQPPSPYPPQQSPYFSQPTPLNSLPTPPNLHTASRATPTSTPNPCAGQPGYPNYPQAGFPQQPGYPQQGGFGQAPGYPQQPDYEQFGPSESYGPPGAQPYGETSARKKYLRVSKFRVPMWLVTIFGYILSAVVGIAVGYLLISLLLPDSGVNPFR